MVKSVIYAGDFPANTKEHVFLGVAQPGRNFSRLKRLFSRAKVAIEQLCDFFNRARLLDLVQGSEDMLVETVVLIWNLARLRFSGSKADLLEGAHFVCSVWSCKTRPAGQEEPVPH